MKITRDIEQRSEAWFRLRAGRPTASQLDRLLTPTGKDSSQWEDFAIELCAQCIRPDEVQWEGNAHTDRGEALEPEAREAFAGLMGFDVREVGFVTRDDEVVGCSPDGFIYSPGTDEVIAGLEIKCPLSKYHARYLMDGAMPAKYRPQVHGSMAITGLRHWYFVSYCPGFPPLIQRVEWDSYTDKIADAVDRFVVYYAELRERVMPILQGNGAT